jgi:uncharacterized repeat protein (TIGR02543 family)
MEFVYGTYKSKNDSSSNILSSITTPTRTYFTYNGHWTAKSGGSRIIANSGAVTGPSVVPSGSSTTVYAHWTRLSYTLTFDKYSGTGGTSTIYGKATSGGWYSNWKCTSAVTSITPPTRTGYVFAGYYSAANGGGTKYVNADGTFTGDFELLVLTDNATVYAYWKARHAITVEANGGTGGTSAFYYVPDDAAFYSNAACTNAVTAVTPPTKSGALLLGIYDTDSTAGTQVVAEDGTISSSWTPSADATVYAQWLTVATITFDKGDGESGDDALVYESSDDSFHVVDDPNPTDEVTPPNWECHRFLGYFSAASGGTQYIDDDGQITNALRSLTITGDFTVYAQWQFVSYKATLAPGEGTADMLAFYCDGSDATFYADDLLAGEPITAVAVPVRAGYDFTGYWTASTGGTKYVDADGAIACGAFSADVQLYAQWQVRTYTATFDYNGGSGSSASKTVTWGTAIGTLPTPTNPPFQNSVFEGWTLNGLAITASFVWSIDGDATLVAKWKTGFGNVEDYFGMASDALVPFDSDSGEERPRVVTREYGHKAADATSAVRWRNPTVRYMVVRDVSLAFVLGRGFPSLYSGNTKVATGYMLTSMSIETGLRQFPVVTVSGVANESGKKGVDAVQTYPFSVTLAARARPQDPMGAITGGGHLQTCTTTFSCDPVVLVENQQPCASDVVNVTCEVSAQTLAVGMEDAPSATQNSGFAEVAKSDVRAGTDRWRYSLTARREY